ncbi:MAG: septum formation initiator family protein [Patescibacteria group bacterium]
MLAKKGKKNQTPLWTAVMVLLILAVTGFLVYTNWRIRERRSSLSERIESLQKEIQDLQEKNSELKEGIDQSQSQEYLEQMARENLDLKKPGEDVIVVKMPSTTTEENTEEKSFWQKIWEKFNF